MSSKKIIIVEDEVIVGTDLRMKLKKLGYEVAGIVNYGEQVMDCVRQNSPDLILMDIRLKGEMDGIEAAEQIKGCINAPVIFLTAYSDETTLERAKETAPQGYLRKPVMLDDLKVAIDIALYKSEMDERLKESALRYKTVADFAYDWETWVDPDGNYKYMSPSCERISGHHRDEFINNPRLFLRLVHPEDKTAVRNHFNECCHIDVEDVCRIDFRIIRKDGEERWIEHYCRGVYDSNGEYLGRRAANRDVTARKKAEHDREKLIRELQTAMSEIKKLSGLLPICSACKKIRDDKGYWNQLETYIRDRSDANFTHSICPECARKLYPEFSHVIEKADNVIKKDDKNKE